MLTIKDLYAIISVCLPLWLKLKYVSRRNSDPNERGTNRKWFH